VELHGAHGYLIDQFLNDGVNTRTDKYGGSAENRARLLDEVLGDLCAAVGNDRVAVRLSPHVNDPKTAFFDVTGADYENTYRVAYETASRHNLAYLLVTEQRWAPMGDDAANFALRHLPLANAEKYSKYYTSGPIIGSSGFTPSSAAAAIEDGSYDATAFGRWYIANPDLPFRVLHGLPLNKYNRATFYVPSSAEGYTDYPTFEQVCEQLGVQAADYIAPADTDVETKAAFEQKFDELVALSEGKLAYPLITVKALGINAVNQGVKETEKATATD
jgi:N-ethylmaleimide reductase